MPKRSSYLDWFLSLVVSTVVAASSYVLPTAWLQDEYHRTLDQQARQGIQRMEMLTTVVVRALSELNEQGFSACSAETLRAMRKQLFLSDHVKDIGFVVDQQLICTTGLGVLSEPVSHPPPDYISAAQNKVWLNQRLELFERAIGAVIVQSGTFNAVIRREQLDNILQTEADWELVYKINDENKHVAGSSGLVDLLSSAQANDYRYKASHCLTTLPYCISTASTQKLFTQIHGKTQSAFLIIVGFIFVMILLLMRKAIGTYRSIEFRVNRGLSRGAFYCLYQPIVELSSRNIIGCEVLARYRDHIGEIYPDTFIPVVAKQGKSWQFTTVLLRRVQVDLSTGLQVQEDFKVNINFFPQDISSGKILELLDSQILDKSAFQFVVEVTEDEQLNHGQSSSTLKLLTDNGFQIAIDDFGTGYSNLNQVKRLNCDTLKIDRSFINEMEGGAVRSTLIPHVVDIAEKIGAKVVAEGIENNMQHDALLEVGVQYGQGWAYGKPMRINQLQQLIEQGV